MKHYGDITKINGAEIPLVDVITGGSPCQDLSVAGRREGLAGERSGLFTEQIRIVKEMRNESYRQLQMRGADVDLRRVQPRYMVWENVPGAFSSNKGEDFRCVLEEICRVTDQTANVPLPEKGKWSNSGCIVGDGWSVAWRVHDAQFWGVPQRRRRISLVADFAGESAPEILFERESLQGNTDESEESRKGTPETIGDGVDKAITFQERAGKPGGAREYSSNTREPAPCQLSQTSSCVSSDGDIAGTLDASYYKGCGLRQDRERTVVMGLNRERVGAVTMDEKCPTIQAAAGESGNNQPMVCIKDAVCVGNGQLQQARLSDKVGALNCMHDQQAVMVTGVDSWNMKETGEVGRTLTTPSGGLNEHIPCVAIDRASFNQGKNAQYDFSVQEELAQTIVAKGPGGVLVRRSEHCVQETTKE